MIYLLNHRLYGLDIWNKMPKITKEAVLKFSLSVTKNKTDAENHISDIIGMNLVTHQTGPDGKKVERIYLESGVDIDSEYYAAITLDRNTEMDVFMVSTEGGVEIEKVASETPDKIIKIWIDPLVGIKTFQLRKLAFGLKRQVHRIQVS